MTIISAFGRLKQEDCEFKVSLGYYIVSARLKKMFVAIKNKSSDPM
jgi:hypothetical protein